LFDPKKNMAFCSIFLYIRLELLLRNHYLRMPPYHDRRQGIFKRTSFDHESGGRFSFFIRSRYYSEGIGLAMTVILNLDQLLKPLKNPVLTIGNFDGVHKGHLALFNKVKERARLIDGQSVVMTFEPHPIKVMMPGNGPPLITPTQQKLKLIEDAGIDVILCVSFTEEFATISPQGFVKDLLVDRIGIREIVVGYDYCFGNKRTGNIDLLQKMGKDYGYQSKG